jgi:poly(3-hydroxybutyrate) depolymerase
MLHIYFHGCRSGREFLGSNHIRYSGFLQVAELNNIVMLFPQAVTNAENQIGCWDTYGLTGPFFATKKGAQVTIVRNMIARILGEDLIVNTLYHKPHWKLPLPFALPRFDLIFPGTKHKIG